LLINPPDASRRPHILLLSYLLSETRSPSSRVDTAKRIPEVMS